MTNLNKMVLLFGLTGLFGCVGEATDDAATSEAESGSGSDSGSDSAAKEGPSDNGNWAAGDTIPSGMDDVPAIQILEVHENGTGEPCGMGKTATLKYKAMLANGNVLDPGTRPFSFRVGSGQAIKGWDVIVSQMRIGDSFTVLLPQQLAYGPDKGDLKFDMELLSVR